MQWFCIRMNHPTPHLEDLAHALRTSTSVVWLTGAGLSVASGIAPYRKASNAVWDHFVTDWGTVERFSENPSAWWRNFWLKAHPASVTPHQPNAGHHAITALVEERPGHTVITQNIDGLHRAARIPLDKLVEIHGRIGPFRCLAQGCPRVDDVIALDVRLADLEDPAHPVPQCPSCGGPVMPLVLLFDESYAVHPAFQFERAEKWLSRAALVVFVGTSFSVGITALAQELAQENGARMFNVNLAAQDGMVNILGPAERTLVELLQCDAVS